jgi:cyanophycin synthetase
VPKGIVIQRQTPIDKRATLQHPPPWVVKPVDKDRGEGVTLGINNQAALDHAIDEALKLSQAVLVEEQIPGTCHRILIIEGKIAFVIKRNPRAIVGNGIDSIRQLVHDHNSEIKRKIPIKRLPKLVLDDLSNVFLAQSDLNEHSVPAFGQHVALRPVQSSQWGGDPEVMTTQLHPANQEIAIRASKLFNLSCAGIDFISTDITKPWYENGAVINEVNYAPVIGRTHAYQRDGTRAYLSAVFPNQGRIPIEVYLGAQTAEQASQRHRELVNEGIQAIYCHDNDVLNHCFESIPLAQAQTIFDRMQMLRLNGEVEHAVIHINTDDSFSLRGLPFDYVHSVISSPTDQLTTMQIHTLNLLKTFYRTKS